MIYNPPPQEEDLEPVKTEYLVKHLTAADEAVRRVDEVMSDLRRLRFPLSASTCLDAGEVDDEPR